MYELTAAIIAIRLHIMSACSGGIPDIRWRISLSFC